MKEKLIIGVIYSQFDEKLGPTAIACHPPEFSLKIRNLVSLKTINIMIGEEKSATKSLAVLPFPSVNLKGLVKFLEIRDKSKRGGIIESSITLLYNEADDSIFYKYLNNFEGVFNKTINKIINLEEKAGDLHQIKEELRFFYTEISNMLAELKSEEISTDDDDAFPSTEEGELGKTKLRFKLIVCGDPMVGKTSIILRFTDHAFKRTYISTIGVNIVEKIIKHKNAKIELIIWDIAGQIKFQMMRKHFYKGADAILLIFDLTSLSSFKNISKWNLDIRRFLGNKKNVGAMLGNKSDLFDERKVSMEAGLKLAKELGFEYVETSALSGKNIDETFHKIAKTLFDLEENK